MREPDRQREVQLQEGGWLGTWRGHGSAGMSTTEWGKKCMEVHRFMLRQEVSLPTRGRVARALRRGGVRDKSARARGRGLSFMPYTDPASASWSAGVVDLCGTSRRCQTGVA